MGWHPIAPFSRRTLKNAAFPPFDKPVLSAVEGLKSNGAGIAMVDASLLGETNKIFNHFLLMPGQSSLALQAGLHSLNSSKPDGKRFIHSRT